MRNGQSPPLDWIEHSSSFSSLSIIPIFCSRFLAANLPIATATMPCPSLTLFFVSAAVLAAMFPFFLPAVMAADASPPSGPNCDDAINSLAACFNFVTGSATLPSEECCAAFASVQKGQPVCLCQLLSSSSNDTSGGTGLNITLALEIPTLCKVTGVDAANCAGVASPTSPPNEPTPASPGAAAPADSASAVAPSTGSGPGNAAHSSRSVPATSIWFAIASLGTVAFSLVVT